MQVIGLTGGVGSGKSYIARRLQERYGMELLIADELGHMVMEPGTDAYAQIVAQFGKSVVREDGTLDRSRLAEMIFHDPQALKRMNEIVHPAVKACLIDYIDRRRDRDGIILLESAIMYETGCDALCDEVWYVSVPEEVRIRRLMEDRGYTREKSCAIMAGQQPDSFFRQRADRVIDNAGEKQHLDRVLEAMIPSKERQVQGAFQNTAAQQE